MRRTSLAIKVRTVLGPHAWLCVPELCVLLESGDNALFKKADRGGSSWGAAQAQAAAVLHRDLSADLLAVRKKITLDSMQLMVSTQQNCTLCTVSTQVLACAADICALCQCTAHRELLHSYSPVASTISHYCCC
jgi:hypothetical protein